MSVPALLVIDMQKGLVAGARDGAAVVERVAALAERYRACGSPVVYVQHCHDSFAPLMRGADGWRLDPRLRTGPDDLVVEKEASDCFCGTPLASILHEHGVDTLVVSGMQTEYCVDTTCRSALGRGFDVILVSDGHTTHDGALAARVVVDHHNAVLAGLVYPDRRIVIARSADLPPAAGRGLRPAGR